MAPTRRSLIYAPRFFLRLEEIHRHIAADDPKAVRRMVERIEEAVLSLRQHPSLGRPGRVAGTRELVVTGTPFLIPYRLRGERVEIITVLHGRQRWPGRL